MAKAPVERGLARDPEVARAQNRADAERLTSVSVDIRPEEDFSDEASAQRNQQQTRLQYHQVRQLQAQAEQYGEAMMPQPTQGPFDTQPQWRSGADAGRDAADLLKFMAKQNQQAIQKYPSLQRALVEAVAGGASVTEKDILRVTNFAEAHRAATAYINAYPLTDADGNNTTQKNILLSANPVQRAAILDVVQLLQSGSDYLETSDTNFLQAGLGFAVGAVLEPFVWANETTQHAFRAGLAGMGDSVAGNYASAVVNPLATAGSIVDNWAATERDQFDERYLQTLRESGQYSALAVDIVADISRRTAEGDPDPIISVIADPKYASNPEADLIFRGLIYRPDENAKLMELVRQVDSANMGSTGQLYATTFTTPDAAQYSEFRGTKGREVGANAASVFYAFALDPTIGGAKIIGAYRAGRYALTKLAPGAKGGAVAALQSKKIAGVETNAARKGIQSFVDDLNKYDELVQTDPAKAATFRTVLARQHKEFPEDVIDEFQKQGIRTVDDFAAFVDETNDVFLIAAGEPSLLAQAGLRAQSSPLAYKPLAQRLNATNVTRRAALMPMSGPVKRLRQKNVQFLSAYFAPQKRGRQTIENFYGNTDDVEQVTANLGDYAMDAGRADQALGILPSAPGSGALGRRLDGFMRLFSSLPSVNHIYIADARDAGQFYKLARTFLTRQHATFLTNAFRDGNVAQRRLMVAGLIRTSAAARGVNLSKGEALAGVDALASRAGKGAERYSATMERRATPAANLVTPAEQAEDTIKYIPSNFDGEEHALHLWQTSDAVAIPSIKDFEALKRYREKAPFKWGDGFLLATPQVVTDIWSAYTLAGLRFSVRSAVEDLWLYTVTAGRLPFLYMGRRASTALREARPSTAWKREKADPARGPFSPKGKPVMDADGNATVVVKSRLGMFASRSRRAADRRAARSAERRKNAIEATGVDPGARFADQLNVFFLQNLDEDTVLKAQAAFKAGDHEPMKRLAIEGINRMRLTGMKDEQVEWIGDLVMTPFGLKYLDEVAETGQYLSKGTLPTADQLVADTAGMTAVKVPYNATSVMGDFKDISGDDWRFGMFWFNALEGIVDHDGPIGKIAVANLYNRQQAVARIAEAIRTDTKFGYMDRFSALYTGRATVEQFASRYYDDVRNMFSGSDGSINRALFERLAPKGEDGMRRVGLHDIDEVTGERSLRITPKGMNSLRKDGSPDIVLGRQELEAPRDLTPMLGSPDRLFTWMGEQYARISKEPLFLANYIEQRTLLKGYEQELAARIGEPAAKKITTGMAADRAYGYVLSYTDNPANRSQLAWKVRNVSRYYRATEDFYRRMQRVAKNNPEAFWKTALTYQVLDDTGFVFTDDNGDKYFAYPGNEMLQEAVTLGFSILNMNFNHMAVDPFMVGGKVKMLAPSTDPNQAFATLMGPVGVIPAKAAFALFPQIRGFERYVVGEYGAQSDWWEAIFPGQVARVLQMLTVDERESVYGDAMKDAMAIAAAQGLIGNKTYETGEDGLTSTNELLGDQVQDWRLLNKIALSIVVTKGMMGFLPVPASPQLYVDNVTLFARQHGLDNMRDGFLDLVGKFDEQGSANPFGDAIGKWWQLHPEGDLMPFTVSKTMLTDNKIDALADVQSVTGLQQWWKDNQSLYNEFKESALFLAPRTGEFSWGAYDLVTSTLGLRMPKDFDTFAMDVLTADDRAEYFALNQSYKDDQLALNPDVDGELIKEIEGKRLSTLKFMRDSNPMLNASLATNFKQMDDNAAVVLDDAKKMTQAMIDRGIDTPVSNGIYDAIATYEDYMSDITAISGSTDAEDEYKRYLKWELGFAMTELAKKDANVEHFINVVLRRLGDFKMIEGES